MKITIVEDEDSEMLQIKAGNKWLFEGNYWDFDRCAEGFAEMFELLGHEVEIIEKPYDDW